tara:strand:- start:3212 stop:4153 length:942 start_codon:yes stop_codon:yes gene_type:complete
MDTFILKKMILYPIFFYLCALSSAQNIYQGEIGFSYNGTVSGSFTSISEDSLVTGISINQVVNDTALLVMASITQQNENEFDLFLAVLRDTIYPIQPRNWEIPGDGDENNPLSLESILVFMPQLDSSFVENVFEFFTDTSGNQEIDEIFNDIFSSFSDNLYLGLEGNLEIEVATDSTLIGTFNTIMIKPVFYFPPHTISINNGTFALDNLNSPILKTFNSYNSGPSEISLFPSYPNPFNPKTKIQLNVQTPIENVLAKIYNSNGQQINTIYSGSIKEGLNSFIWEPKNIASGMYLFVIQTPFSVQTQKLLYLK